MLRKSVILFTILMLGACAGVTLGPQSFTAPASIGKPQAEVSKLVAASDARYFFCTIQRILDTAGANAPDLGGNIKTDVTLPPGQYQVTLHCSNGTHIYSPTLRVFAKAGKSYRISGEFIDDSITIFTMKMRANVTELP
jgi:hypothetical protein